MSSPRRRIGTVDLDTGEVLDGVVALSGRRPPPSPYGDRWMQISQDPLLVLAADKSINGNAWRVFIYCISRLDFDNYLALSPASAEKDLGILARNISTALRTLERRGVLVPGDRIGGTPTYRLNARMGWKGKIVNLFKELGVSA